jgi:hypothetical protein
MKDKKKKKKKESNRTGVTLFERGQRGQHSRERESVRVKNKNNQSE